MKYEQYLYSAEDLCKVLDCSIAHSYKVIRELNKELKAKGYSVEQGKVPIKFLEEKFYGLKINAKEQSGDMSRWFLKRFGYVFYQKG